MDLLFVLIIFFKKNVSSFIFHSVSIRFLFFFCSHSLSFRFFLFIRLLAFLLTLALLVVTPLLCYYYYFFHTIYFGSFFLLLFAMKGQIKTRVFVPINFTNLKFTFNHTSMEIFWYWQHSQYICVYIFTHTHSHSYLLTYNTRMSSIYNGLLMTFSMCSDWYHLLQLVFIRPSMFTINVSFGVVVAAACFCFLKYKKKSR